MTHFKTDGLFKIFKPLSASLFSSTCCPFSQSSLTSFFKLIVSVFLNIQRDTLIQIWKIVNIQCMVFISNTFLIETSKPVETFDRHWLPQNVCYKKPLFCWVLSENKRYFELLRNSVTRCQNISLLWPQIFELRCVYRRGDAGNTLQRRAVHSIYCAQIINIYHFIFKATSIICTRGHFLFDGASK